MFLTQLIDLITALQRKTTMPKHPLLHIHDLSIIDNNNQQPLLNKLSLTVHQHRTLAIVGESGSGKSLLSKAIMGLLPSSLTATGKIQFQQQSLLNYNNTQWQQLRGKQINLIVQNAMGAFDPMMTIGAQFIETLACHFSLSHEEQQQRITSALQKTKLDQVHNLLGSHPHQLSGGQLQRVMIAFALALEPTIIIADEPTTSLDAITQYEIIQQLTQLIKQQNMTLIFITHDLSLVKEIADDIAVMKEGELIEYASKEQLFNAPQHPYTRFLLETRRKLTQRFEKIMSKPHVING